MSCHPIEVSIHIHKLIYQGNVSKPRPSGGSWPAPPKGRTHLTRGVFSLGLYGHESSQGLRLDGHLGSMRDGAGLPAPSFSRLWCRTKSQNNPESVLRIVGNDRSSEKNHREINSFERSSDRQNDVDSRASPDCYAGMHG